MQEVKVSVIIPVYNAENYIEECIESVRHQTLQELEIICIDDGSDDNTIQIIRKLQESDKRILLLEQIHAGAGSARNYGMTVAKGEYLSFLDADDWYLDENALKTMVCACNKHNICICGSYLKMIKDDMEEDMPLFKNMEIAYPDGSLVLFSEFQEDFFYQCFIFQREFLLQHKIRFPEYLRYQDPPFFLKAMSLAGSFWVVPVTLYGYRYGHQNSAAIAEKIKYILMGIRDTLQIAVANDYYILYGKIIERINVLYYDGILNGLSDEVMQLLLEINRLNQQYSKAKPIKPLEDIYAHYGKLNKLKTSYSMMYKIVKIQQNRSELKKYFQTRKINKVVIYGLGVYGKILLNEIKEAGIVIVCCIDREVKEYEGIKVKKPEDDIPECDAFIISLLYSDEVVAYYKKKISNIITFQHIVDDIVFQMK